MPNKMQPSKKACYQVNKDQTGKRIIYTVVSLILVVAAAVSFFINPLHMILRYKTRISEGSLYYESLQKTNIEGVYIEVHIFNITNAEEFLSGLHSKLKVEEIGPFTYQELRTNVNFELDEDLGVMRYSPKIFTRFVPEKSIAHPQDVNITVPNIAMLAVSSKLSKSSYFTRMGFNMLTKQLKSQPILKINAQEYLWGFEEPLIKFGHNLMPGLITFDKMGILDRLYDAGDIRLEVGSTNEDKFMIKKYNGESGLTALGYKNKPTRCNSLVDTYEGIVYPPDLTEETPLRLYRNAFCRIMNLQYQGTRTMDYGPEAFHYSFSDTSFINNTDNECLCRNEDCVNGITDLSPCFFGLKFTLSNAHFLDVDPSIYERIEGINPNEELHSSEIIIDPKLGTVLNTRICLQLNVDVADVSFNSGTSPFSDMMVPAVYFKIVQPELEEDRKHKIWVFYVLIPNVIHSIEAILFIIGLALLTLVVKSFLPQLYNKKKIRIENTHSEPLFDNNQRSKINKVYLRREDPRS